MTDSSIVRAVVRYLGLAALLLIAVLFLLLRQVIAQGAGKGTIDAATLGAIGSVSTLTGTVLGALGAVLVSTRSVDEPTDVRVVDEPIEVEPVDGDAGQSVLVMALVAAAVCLLMLIALDIVHIR